jgi:7,8-dihydropterin-6-yl-methyl-4-(beta-D-ribofuranosyl)aminobenzene 5'-phosphate synthase
MRARTAAPIVGGLVAAGLAAPTIVKFYRNRDEAERLWAGCAPDRFEHPSSVPSLSVLPLVDFYTDRDDLVGEPGVSYLVRAGDTTVLFDVGLNHKKTSPSALVHNMEALGVSRSEVDLVFISHRHMDHIGGLAAQKARTFELTPGDDQPLAVDAYVPEEMSHPSAHVKLVDGPAELAPGVFTIGPIARSLWLMGLTREQALAVNVEGKGIVLIIGCGHQKLERAIERTQALFDIPLYGVIGGLHFPVTGSRMPYGLQRVIGTGKPPWNLVSRADVRATVDFLKAKDPAMVGLSPHDSCDWSVGAFKEAFGERYLDIAVGREIIV